MIPFQPLTVEEHKIRFKAALEELYIQLDVKRGIRVRPGTIKENVFDFLDRLRLVISKEQQPDGKLVIHISGSVSEVAEDGVGQMVKLEDHHIHHIIEHWALISGITAGVEFLGISNDVVAHFYYRLDN